jgi:hypothetical protein
MVTAVLNRNRPSHLRIIMDNQTVIISELKKIPLEVVQKQMTRFDRENYKEVLKQVQNNIPDYPDLSSTPHDYKTKKTGES